MAKASSISLRQLTGTVDGAVKAAIDRHKAKPTGNFIINPGILAGPLLDPATDLKVAQQIADEITAEVQLHGGAALGGGIAAQTHAAGAPGGALAAPRLTSGVLITKTHILCGFFPYEAPVLNVEF